MIRTGVSGGVARDARFARTEAGVRARAPTLARVVQGGRIVDIGADDCIHAEATLWLKSNKPHPE